MSQPITREMRDRAICFLFEIGYTVAQIASLVKLSPSNVHRILRNRK